MIDTKLVEARKPVGPFYRSNEGPKSDFWLASPDSGLHKKGLKNSPIPSYFRMHGPKLVTPQVRGSSYGAPHAAATRGGTYLV